MDSFRIPYAFIKHFKPFYPIIQLTYDNLCQVRVERSTKYNIEFTLETAIDRNVEGDYEYNTFTVKVEKYIVNECVKASRVFTDLINCFQHQPQARDLMLEILVKKYNNE